ncbi:hemicentin-1-like, partial [Corticium candelabrum]|uniref:hemicentin-1-like n=1 Tax=Corticium candelabrum TaxID=121492 RepID=UPI002E25F7C4
MTNDRLSYSTNSFQGALVGTLVIKTVTVDDNGDYRCIAVSSGGQTQSDVVAVRVQVAPEISVSPGKHIAVIGDDSKVEFELMIKNANIVFPAVVGANIVWKFTNQIITASTAYSFSGANDRIFITGKESLSGNYSVEVTNAAGRTTAAFQLSVLVPVTIDQFLANTTVNETESLTLNCSAHGVPEPNIALYRVVLGSNQKLTGSMIVSGKLLNGDPYMAYNINSTEGLDSGQYKCIATNDVRRSETAISDQRTSESSVIITVNVAARIDIPSRPLSISVVRNRSLALHCSATGTPTPTYSWIHDSQSVD